VVVEQGTSAEAAPPQALQYEIDTHWVDLTKLYGELQAKHVVMAAGYASQTWLKQSVAQNRSSYAFITDPIEPADLGVLALTMIWESASPLHTHTRLQNRWIYHY
jgi:glycine/D-amino acid oxidase-like deaminating enzyme